MAGRPKEPIDLIAAKGLKHLSKQEYQERKDSEVKVPFVNVKPPSYLGKNQRKKFKELAKKLLEIGIMTELDVDCLAMYVLAHELYIEYSKALAEAIEEGKISVIKELQNLQDKAFKQALASARTLGLTITDRCKIVVPLPPDDGDDEL